MSSLSRPRAAVAATLTLGTATAGLLLAPAASAAEMPAAQAPASVVAGQEFVVSGTDCDGDPLKPDFVPFVGLLTDSESDNPDDYAYGDEVDADGTWSLTVHFPANTPAGEHEIYVECQTAYNGDDRVHEYPLISLTVNAPAAAPAPATVAPTGALRGVAANTPGVASTSTGATTGKTAEAGQKIVKILTGFKPGEKVTVTLHSTPVTVGTFTADDKGVVTATFTLPAGTPVGAHDLVFEGNMGTYFQEPITVAAAGSASTGGLAYTGASIALPLTLGAGLLAAGGGVLVATRRRSAGAPQA